MEDKKKMSQAQTLEFITKKGGWVSRQEVFKHFKHLCQGTVNTNIFKLVYSGFIEKRIEPRIGEKNKIV